MARNRNRKNTNRTNDGGWIEVVPAKSSQQSSKNGKSGKAQKSTRNNASRVPQRAFSGRDFVSFMREIDVRVEAGDAYRNALVEAQDEVEAWKQYSRMLEEQYRPHTFSDVVTFCKKALPYWLLCAPIPFAAASAFDTIANWFISVL